MGKDEVVRFLQGSTRAGKELPSFPSSMSHLEVDFERFLALKSTKAAFWPFKASKMIFSIRDNILCLGAQQIQENHGTNAERGRE